MSNPPPQQLLNREFLQRCRGIVLKGGWHKEIAQTLGVNYDTAEGWYSRNAQGFRVKMDSWKLHRMLEKAQKILDETLDMDVYTPVLFFGKEIGTQINPRMVKIKVDSAKFVLEMLSKDFKRKQEVSGLNGEPITVQVVNYGDVTKLEVGQVEEGGDDL